jgi:hypothetical protein
MKKTWMMALVTNQIIIDEIREEEKEQVRNLLVESYQQYEHSYKNPEGWKMYLENIKASVDNPYVDKILVAKSNQDILGSLQLFQSSEKAYARPDLEISDRSLVRRSSPCKRSRCSTRAIKS